VDTFNVVCNRLAILAPVKLFLRERGPKFNCLCTHSGIVGFGNVVGDLNDLLKVELDVIVLLTSKFDQDLHRVFTNVNIRNFEGGKNFIHNESAFLLNLEVLGGIWEGME